MRRLVGWGRWSRWLGTVSVLAYGSCGGGELREGGPTAGESQIGLISPSTTPVYDTLFGMGYNNPYAHEVLDTAKSVSDTTMRLMDSSMTSWTIMNPTSTSYNF